MIRRLGPEPGDVLATAKALLAAGRKRKALARIYDAVDTWICRSDPSRCDQFLTAAAPEELDTTALVGILTITLAGQGRLTGRAEFVERVRRHLERTESERVDELLAGLEGCDDRAGR